MKKRLLLIVSLPISILSAQQAQLDALEKAKTTVAEVEASHAAELDPVLDAAEGEGIAAAESPAAEVLEPQAEAQGVEAEPAATEPEATAVPELVVIETPAVEDGAAEPVAIALEVVGEEAAAPTPIERPLPELPDAPLFEVPEDEVFVELPGATAASPEVDRDAETISVDFPQEDVRNILRNVADLYELNVVIPDTLVGSVSVKLRNVTWRQVFDVILEPLNFTYIEDGNIIKIKNREELAAEPVVTRVFVINFANAQQISGSIGPLIDPAVGGKVQVDTRSNALVITERPSRMGGIQEIIEKLDRPTEQVMIESKFVEITDRDQKNLGLDWQSLSGYGVRAGPFQRDYTNESGRAIANQNSVIGSQQSTNTSGVRDSLLSTGSELTSDTLWTGDLLRSDTAVFSADAFSLVLSALETQTDVELISNPTVVTVNNTSATINIGEEYPLPRYTYNNERGTFEVSDFEYKNIGINLAVTPQINSAGFINLKIQPEISNRTGEVPFGGAGGALIPIITTRKTESTVTIKSGYTLAIGGLIEKNSENTTSKVPVLGSLPVFGRLFSSEGKTINQRNLIVFITAKILSASGATYRDVFSQRTLHEMGIKARDLPGYEPPESESELFQQIQDQRDEIERLRSEMELRQQYDLLQEAYGKQQKKDEKQRSAPREVRRRYR